MICLNWGGGFFFNLSKYIHNSVARIMKKALPENAKIAKEAKECVQECVSEFISFITSEGKTLFWSKCHVDFS